MGYTNPNHPSVAPATRRDLLAFAYLLKDLGAPGLSFADKVGEAYAQADKVIAVLDAAKS